MLTLAVVASVSPRQSNAGSTSRAASRGQAIFKGSTPLVARIRGHQSGLPSEVVRCANCHASATTNDSSAQTRGQVGGGSGFAPTIAPGFAPRIDRALLLEVRSRRGGPPSAYDGITFCKLLRTGVDPASILIAREMPVYDIDEARCRDLWRYLIQEPKAP